MKASHSDHLEIVKYLISVGVNKYAKDKNGQNALHHTTSCDKTRDYLKSLGLSY